MTDKQLIILREQRQKDHAIRAILELDISGPLLAVEIKPHVNSRSLRQNRLYWKWIGEICEIRGWGLNVTHEALRDNFIPVRVELGPNGPVEYRPSTTKLTTKQMSEYMEKVSAHAATEFGVIVSHPDDHYE